MEILHYPNQTLREKSLPVTVFDELLKTLSEHMFSLMYQYGGIGLAAIQIGIPRKIIVIDATQGLEKSKQLTLINPVIVSSFSSVPSDEGCLSVPGMFGTVDRYACIEIDFQDLSGNKQKRICSGLEAFVIQHELDHLDGILFIDKVNGELEDYTKDIKFA